MLEASTSTEPYGRQLSKNWSADESGNPVDRYAVAVVKADTVVDDTPASWILLA